MHTVLTTQCKGVIIIVKTITTITITTTKNIMLIIITIIMIMLSLMMSLMMSQVCAGQVLSLQAKEPLQP